jgi:asparagine synthase (glutamine-hydrolysing)
MSIEEGQKIETYWSAREIIEHGAENSFVGIEEEALDQLDVLLRDSVRMQMIADVNLGAFLSGGIDSSLVVALMQSQNNRPVKTFSLGFMESGFDEATQAKKIASHLGTDHTELYITPEQALAIIPKLPTLNDEPFSDSSQIPTYLVSALAKQQVTVSLSGDGGDELFGGYNEYLLESRLNKMVGWIPLSIRRAFSASILSVGPETYSRSLRRIDFLFSPYGRPAPMGHKLHKLAELLPFEQPESLHHSLMTHWPNGQSPLLETKKVSTPLTNHGDWARVDSLLQRVTYLDLVTYLTDDILAKVDRSSMAVGLEARVPLLDHRVVEFSARIPASMKISHGRGKWLLRELLSRYVPQRLIQQKKLGFSVPIAAWLRGPLREWAEDLLSRDRLIRQGLFEPDVIARLWAEHMSGRRNWHTRLWDVLMFQAWSDAHTSQFAELSLVTSHAN